MSEQEFDPDADLDLGAVAVGEGELVEGDATLEEGARPDSPPPGSELERPPGGRAGVAQTTLWHRWLGTIALSRRGTPAPSLFPAPTPLPRPSPSPTVIEEVTALGTAFDSVTAIEWQKLWLAAQRRPWRSLAVVPVGGGVPTARVARALAEVGSAHLGLGMMVTDATSLTLEWLQASVESWTKRRSSIERMLIALGPVLERPASLAIAQAADASILCVALGDSSISEARRTIEEIGRSRFLGTVTLTPRKSAREQR